MIMFKARVAVIVDNGDDLAEEVVRNSRVVTAAKALALILGTQAYHCDGEYCGFHLMKVLWSFLS